MTVEFMWFSLGVAVVYFCGGVALGWLARGIKEGR